MKILICAGIFPPDVGGPATYSRALALELAKRGHEIAVVSYSDKKKVDDYYPFPVIRILRSQFKPRHYLQYLLAILQHGRKADVFYAQDQVSAGFPAYLASKILGKPFVLKVTGDYSWEQAANRGLTSVLIDEFQTLPSYDPVIARIRKFQMKVIKAAKAVIVPAEYLKRLLMSWSVAEQKIQVIYNAVNLPEISETKEQLREKFSIAPDEFLIVSAGRDVKWKGFGLLREIVAELQSEYPRQKRGSPGAAKLRLFILNNVPQKTLHEYFRAADLFVLNTGYEGLSNTLVEALSLGLPVVTTNVCGNPEVLEDSKSGFLVEYNNREQLKQAILKLYQDKGLRENLAEAGRQNLEKFSFTKMINETEQFLISAGQIHD